LVSVSNEDRYDKHQDELLAALAEEGYLYWCRRLDQLAQAIAEAQAKPMRRYTTPACRIHLVIEEYLQAAVR
jgi:hypothetical protein